MDVKIINPFLEATINIASVMAQLDVKVGRAILKQDNIAQGDVTGLIKLQGNFHEGSLAFSFSQDALRLIYQKMLGEPLTLLDQSALDLAGEFTNMVCGGAKQRLADKGYEFELTQPSMLSGDQHQVNHLGLGPVLTVPLELEQGTMYIEVCLNR